MNCVFSVRYHHWASYIWFPTQIQYISLCSQSLTTPGTPLEEPSSLHTLLPASWNTHLKGINVKTAEIPHFGVKNDKMKILLSVFNVSRCSLVYLSNMRILINCMILVAMVTILAGKWGSLVTKLYIYIKGKSATPMLYLHPWSICH